MIEIKRATLIALLFFMQAVSAEDLLYEAKNFDVAGVKLGMNTSQAVTAITAQLGIAASDLKFDPYPMKDVVLEKKLPKYFVYEHDGVRIQVSMVAAIPIDQENPLRVNSISYEVPRTEANMQQMRSRAFEKYGQPSNGVRPNDHVSRKYSWCQYDTSIKHNSCFNAIGAKLELTAPKLNLHDPSYLAKIQTYMNDKKAAKMAF